MPLGRCKVDGFDGLMLSQKLDVTRIARKHASSPEQVLIAFHINRNIAVLVKSRDEQRIRENLNAAQLRLDEDDMRALLNMNSSKRFCDFKIYMKSVNFPSQMITDP